MSQVAAFNAIETVVQLIPCGCVSSYARVADLAGLPRRARLVGTVLKKTSRDDLPWHRVVRADGGFAFPVDSVNGQQQRDRLRQEGVAFRGDKVDMAVHLWQPSLDDLLIKLNF
ncbi:MAG: MGMT family protein [Gammaproteobacteria bacterium]|nr:MGMT family protein [Gammaproteobacteria bacterium]NVK89318.1 MGMT family protein [Gammaproteobacteria bacterium]